MRRAQQRIVTRSCGTRRAAWQAALADVGRGPRGRGAAPAAPSGLSGIPRWIYPMFLVAFLVVLIVGDPGRIDRQRRWLRVTTGLMIALITGVDALAATRLVVGILGNTAFDTAGQLLAIGVVIWLTNVIAFALVLGCRQRRRGGPSEGVDHDHPRVRLS